MLFIPMIAKMSFCAHAVNLGINITLWVINNPEMGGIIGRNRIAFGPIEGFFLANGHGNCSAFNWFERRGFMRFFYNKDRESISSKGQLAVNNDKRFNGGNFAIMLMMNPHHSAIGNVILGHIHRYRHGLLFVISLPCQTIFFQRNIQRSNEILCVFNTKFVNVYSDILNFKAISLRRTAYRSCRNSRLIFIHLASKFLILVGIPHLQHIQNIALRFCIVTVPVGNNLVNGQIDLCLDIFLTGASICVVCNIFRCIFTAVAGVFINRLIARFFHAGIIHMNVFIATQKKNPFANTNIGELEFIPLGISCFVGQDRNNFDFVVTQQFVVVFIHSIVVFINP